MNDQPPIEHTFENPITPHLRVNWLLVIIIVVGFFAVLTTGYFLGTNSSKTKADEVVAEPTPTEYVMPTAAVEPTSEITPNSTNQTETAGWKTYTNTVYHFEFKYPPELTPEQTVVETEEPEKRPRIILEGNLNKARPNSRFAISIGDLWHGYKCTSDDECYQAYIDKIPGKEISTVIINKKVRGVEINHDDPTDPQGTLFRIDFPMSRNGKLFLLALGLVNYSPEEIEKARSLQNQILATFKFLE